MRSPMMTLNPALEDTSDLVCDEAARGAYSDLKVMKSAAGWYVGTSFDEYDAEGRLVFSSPGSRDSHYHATEAEADLTLRQMLGGDLTDARFAP